MTTHIHLQVFFYHVLSSSRIRSLSDSLLFFSFRSVISIVSLSVMLKNMTHLSNMNWMGVCPVTEAVPMNAELERMKKKNGRTSSIFEKLQSSVKWSAVCRAFCVCASQALNPNSWINVFSCWISCSVLTFFFFFSSFDAHKIIFTNHIFAHINRVNRVAVAILKSILCDFITYSAFVPFQCAYYGNHSQSVQRQIKSRRAPDYLFRWW